MTSFSDFALGAPILKALADQGHTVPTPIQVQAIAPVLSGRDLCGIAQTGTGKTAAFALPILQKLSLAGRAPVPSAPRVLVLTPTRELASQIAQSFDAYGAGLRIKTAVVFGGVSQRPQADTLKRGVSVLVATPGRLLDLVEQKLLSLGQVEVLVVDEADQMLDLGFIVPLKRIVKLIPSKRQTLFFSATMPKAISQLADSLLRDPVQVAVAPVATTVELVAQSVMHVPSASKPALLHSVLGDPAMQRVLVFTRTKHGADKVVRGLERARIQAAAIHGNKSQAQRERALEAFRSGATRVLVATDIAARGIHVESVSHVINYELPNIPESYVHRIGRTARAGASGVAISFCNSEERAYLRDIEKLTRMQLTVVPLPAGLEAVAMSEPKEELRRPQRGKQRSRQAASRREVPAHARRENAGGASDKAARPQRQSRRSSSKGHDAGATRGGFDEKTGLPSFFSRPQRRGAEVRP